MSVPNPALAGLDTAIANLAGEVDAAVSAIASLEAKANGAGIDVSAEVATITGFHDKLLAAVSSAVTSTVPGPVVTSAPAVDNPPVNPFPPGVVG